MKRVHRLYLFLMLAQTVLVFVCGPHSCEWGNAVYSSFGLLALVLSFLLPLFQKPWPKGKRVGTALLFLLGSLFVWCAGFLLGDFRIMCRLF